MSAIVMAGIAGLSAGFGSAVRNKQAKAAAEAAMVRDKAIMNSTVQTVNRINQERSTLNTQVTSALTASKAQAQKAKGTITADAAASDTMGASVTAHTTDVMQKAAEAEAVLYYNNHLGQERLNNALTDSINSSISAMHGVQIPTTPSGWGQAINVGGAALGGYYGAGGKITFGI